MNDTSSRGKLVKRLMAMVVLGSLLGSLLAGGIAFAHTEIDVPKSVGSSWYETRHQQCLNHHCDFVEKSIGETSSDWTDFRMPHIRYYNGQSNDGVVFGPLWIIDEYGEHPVFYNHFVCIDIQGADETMFMNWYWGGHDAPNYGTMTWMYPWEYGCMAPDNAGVHKFAMAKQD